MLFFCHPERQFIMFQITTGVFKCDFSSQEGSLMCFAIQVPLKCTFWLLRVHLYCDFQLFGPQKHDGYNHTWGVILRL